MLRMALPIAALAAALFTTPSMAAAKLEGPVSWRGGKLLATGGVTSVEGAAGGGITPWAVIGGYGAKGQFGANATATHVITSDYGLTMFGLMVGIDDRLELNVAQQIFDTKDVGAQLGLGKNFKFRQNIFGAKVRLVGDAVLEQDSWLPQLSLGMQYKDNERDAVLSAIGARNDSGFDWYLSATKLILDESLLFNATLRFTRANELGILGFGGKNNSYEPQLEGSIGWQLSRNWLVGAEYRMKPDNLSIVKESDWADLFVAWVPSKNVSLTLAFVDLGTVAIKDNQRGLYLSLQMGF